MQEIVSLAREVIPLEDNKAEAKNIMFNGTRFLVLEIPSFYRDEENPDRIGGSLSFDVSNLIKQNNGFDVLLLDLRNNGGGSLSEAIAMVSLFVDGGVAVQVKMPNGTVNPINVKENAKIWDGPMVTLVNRRSASASEILAAALQDYERSLIVGETTYGKGSAQTLFDLDGWAKMPVSVYGQVNLTTMMFFRPSGQTTQKKVLYLMFGLVKIVILLRALKADLNEQLLLKQLKIKFIISITKTIFGRQMRFGCKSSQSNVGMNNLGLMIGKN